MKLKSILYSSIFAPTALLISSCTNEDMSRADGFTPIRPRVMTMDNGDIFYIVEGEKTGIADTSYYVFTFTPAASSTTSSATGYYTYTDSSNDSRTKTITFFYGADIETGTGISTTSKRTIIVKFISATEGYVYSDDGIEDNNGNTFRYETGSLIEFASY